MAHGRRGDNRGQRDAIDVANPLSDIEGLLAPIQPLPDLRPMSPLPLRDEWSSIEDRRLFDPMADFMPARNFDGQNARTRRIPDSNPNWSTVGFDDPKHAVVCARRKERREVYFAKNLRRRGRGGARRRNWWSDYKC